MSTVLMLRQSNENIVDILLEISSNYNFYEHHDADTLLEEVSIQSPSVVIIELGNQPQEKYFSIIRSLKSSRDAKKVSVIVIGSHEDDPIEQYLELGVNDFIIRPYQAYHIKLKIDTQLKIINHIKEIEALSLTDKLTGLPNRRSFDLYLDPLVRSSIRSCTPLCIVICDIDRFKSVNDTYGHNTGDIVLKETALAIKTSLRREVDFVSRWGGEEFVMIFHDVPPVGISRVAEYVRGVVEANVITVSSELSLSVTISLGVWCGVPTELGSVDDYLEIADQALYEAKQTGRNKVCIRGDYNV